MELHGGVQHPAARQCFYLPSSAQGVEEEIENGEGD